MGKERKGENIKCKACEKEFYVVQSKKSTARFCSRSCRFNTPVDDYVRICKKCNISFGVTDETKKQIYCSLSCLYDRKETTEKIYYFVYKTINLINSKEYIGIHKTANLEDGYIGNGISRQKDALRRIEKSNVKSPFVKAVSKHGYENFKREIIKFCQNYEELLVEEAKLVDLAYIKRRDTYNVQLGGEVSYNLNIIKSYDLTDINGVRYSGKNIKDFCIKNNLCYVGIRGLIKGKLKTSQGFQRTADYKKPQKYIIVNIETQEIFKTTNLLKWCESNAKELVSQGSTRLHNIIFNGAHISFKKWWACKEEEWKGYADVTKTVYKYDNKYEVVDENGVIYKVEDLREFCNKHNLDQYQFREMIRGKYKKCKNFKLI